MDTTSPYTSLSMTMQSRFTQPKTCIVIQQLNAFACLYGGRLGNESNSANHLFVINGDGHRLEYAQIGKSQDGHS